MRINYITCVAVEKENFIKLQSQFKLKSIETKKTTNYGLECGSLASFQKKATAIEMAVLENKI